MPAHFDFSTFSLFFVVPPLVLTFRRFDVTNLGAILFAHKLSAFNRIARKATRVIIYSGQDRTKAVREQVGARGYAAGFERMIEYINNQIPQNELIGQALRTEVRMYPEIAIRELVANALIHQDFHITGAGPMIGWRSNVSVNSAWV